MLREWCTRQGGRPTSAHSRPLTLAASGCKTTWARRTLLVVAVAACLTACVVVPASRVHITLDPKPGVALREGRKVAVLYSSDHAPETAPSTGAWMVGCIRSALLTEAPGVTVMSEQDFLAAVFPGLRPLQILMRVETLPAVVTRTDIASRIERAGVDYVVFVGGGVETIDTHPSGFAPGLAFLGWKTDANLSATVFDLRVGAAAGLVGARTRGSVFFVAPLYVPLGGGVDPAEPTCRALGREVVRALRGGTR